MTETTSLSEGLKAYLGELSPRTQCLLVREIERARLAGTSEPAHDFVLQAVRGLMRDQLAAAKRTGTPTRIFCEPLEPFLTDDERGAKHRGWIRRASLDAAWRFLSTHAGFPEADEICGRITDALMAGDYDRGRTLGAELRARAAPVLVAALERADADGRNRMQLAAQLEGERGLEDLSDIAAVMRLETQLEKLAASLPATIHDLSPDLVGLILAKLKYERTDLIYPLMVVYRRLARPGQILRLLVSSAGTDTGPQLTANPLSACVDIVLADLDFLLEGMTRLVGRPSEFDALISTVRRFYALSGGLASGIDINSAGNWHRSLAEKRRRASDIITGEVSRTPAVIRRALKPRRRNPDEIVAPSQDDLAEAEHAARLMEALRPYRSELAVNEVLTGVISQVEKFVEAVSTGILKDLRRAGEAERGAAQAMFDAAVSINAVVFGEDYAALLHRSSQLAANGTDPGDGGDAAAPAA